MPETVQTDAGSGLRERFEALATRIVLEGPGKDVVADLDRLSNLAGEDGCPETARAAAELARAAAGKRKTEAREAVLHAGMARLRQTLDREVIGATGAAPVEPPPPPASAASLSADPELVREFILESREHLSSIESCILDLERNPTDADAIHTVFRGFHTIKGLAGFLEFPAILEIAHEVESLLDLARKGKLSITPAVADVVLAAADYLKLAIAGVEASLEGKGPVPLPDHRDLLARIRAQVTDDGHESDPAPERAPEKSPHEPPPEVAGPKAEETGNAQARPAHESSVRVDIAKLDYLMDMVGEMVIAQSLIRHNPTLASTRDPRLQGDLAQLARTTNEVQRTAMAMRMVPIGQLFQRTARLVRDLSRRFGKAIELEIRGEDTELDKSIAEELADPLLHMVRNAIDHGVESAEVRAAAGKDATAQIRLAAYHQGGQIVIEIADDGRGLDREKILDKARRNGLIEAAAQLTESEIFHLIFEPGFSTADRITDISGRGVGMDVVRRHVEKLRGRIDIQSEAGRGTTFFLKLPLTLAIIEGLVVVVGKDRYIIPVFAVREMFRPAREALSTVQGRGEMALVRGRLLPIVRLYRQFHLQPRSEDPCDGLLVVAESEGRQFCVLVDDLVGKQEVVIKSLGENLKHIPGIAGGAILGDGRVGLILDTQGLFHGGRHE